MARNQELKDPKNVGRGSWVLPRSVTALQKAKLNFVSKNVQAR